MNGDRRHTLMIKHLPSVIAPMVLCFFAATMRSEEPKASPTPKPQFLSAPAMSASPKTGFAGDSICLTCHRTFSGYETTAHLHSLQLPSASSVLGSFKPGENTVQTLDPRTSLFGEALSFEMKHVDNEFLVTAAHSTYDDSAAKAKLEKHTEHIGIITGSGVRGQSYLYWAGSNLFELPISYWSAGRQWINSPGYPDGTAIFERPVSPRCLECHTTFIQVTTTGGPAYSYMKSSLVVGITCERCHGAGMDHIRIQKHSGRAATVVGSSIVNPARLSRDRQVDICALCHNGTQREATAPAFSYMAGEVLDHYFKPHIDASVERVDVHGDQVGLLKRSRCYQSSPQMSCSTCHDVHAPERDPEAYSAKCLSCHRTDSCRVVVDQGDDFRGHCIGCHMPLETSKAIVATTEGRVTKTKLRTHWIKVYPATLYEIPLRGSGSGMVG
jgi:hypothetical protein